MSAIKDGRFPVMLDKQRHLLFSLNVLDELQDKAGGYDKLDAFLSGKDLFKNLKWLLTLLVNEGAEPNEDVLSEAQIGRMIHTGNMKEVQGAIFQAFTKGNRGDEQSDSPEEYADDAEYEDGEKNAGSGRG